MVKGTILPPLHRDDDVIISREVPIINVLLDDAMKEDINLNKKITKSLELEREAQNKKMDPVKTKNSACDAGTQTDKIDKKGACQLM